VSTRIRDAEAALASERLAREQLARQLRIKSTELQRVQSEHASAMEDLHTVLSPAATAQVASGDGDVRGSHANAPSATPYVDVVALQAQLADRESRIRTLSTQVSEIQRRLGDSSRQARILALESEAGILRETRAELQVRTKTCVKTSELVYIHAVFFRRDACVKRQLGHRSNVVHSLGASRKKSDARANKLPSLSDFKLLLTTRRQWVGANKNNWRQRSAESAS
jgi:hypothetical protein